MPENEFDNVVVASYYRLLASNFRHSANILSFEINREREFRSNTLCIPFYYLMSHAIELLLKCALLKRNFPQKEMKKHEIRHNLIELTAILGSCGVPISDNTLRLIALLSDQHEKHQLRYTVYFDDGQKTFLPEPAELFGVFDELLAAGRISTYGV